MHHGLQIPLLYIPAPEAMVPQGTCNTPRSPDTVVVYPSTRALVPTGTCNTQPLPNAPVRQFCIFAFQICTAVIQFCIVVIPLCANLSQFCITVIQWRIINRPVPYCRDAVRLIATSCRAAIPGPGVVYWQTATYGRVAVIGPPDTFGPDATVLQDGAIGAAATAVRAGGSGLG